MNDLLNVIYVNISVKMEQMWDIYNCDTIAYDMLCNKILISFNQLNDIVHHAFWKKHFKGEEVLL